MWIHSEITFHDEMHEVGGARFRLDFLWKNTCLLVLRGSRFALNQGGGERDVRAV